MQNLLRAFDILKKYRNPVSLRINLYSDALKNRISIPAVPVSEVTDNDILELKTCGWDGKGKFIYLDIEL